MDVLSDRTLDSLRLEFESLEDDIAALGARIERIKRPERYATDFDYHLLIMQKTAMENLRNVIGMRLVREYWKKYDEADRRGGKGGVSRTMKALVKSAKGGFHDCRRTDGWGGTNGDREDTPVQFRADEGRHLCIEDESEDAERDEAAVQEELKQVKGLCDRGGIPASSTEVREHHGRNRQRTRNRNRGGEKKWGVRPKHLAPKKDAAPSAVPQTDAGGADASGGAVAETKPAVAVPEEVSTTTTTTTETGGSENV